MLILGKCAYFGKMCLFWEMCLFLENVLILRNVLILGMLIMSVVNQTLSAAPIARSGCLLLSTSILPANESPIFSTIFSSKSLISCECLGTKLAAPL